MPTAPGNRFETFEHGSDIGVRGRGASREAAFEQAAVALTSIVCDPAAVRADQEVEVTVAAAGADDEALLVDWLNAVIFEMATRSMLFARYRVTDEDARLRARLFGERVDVGRHQPAVEPKGATFTALRVRCEQEDRKSVV